MFNEHPRTLRCLNKLNNERSHFPPFILSRNLLPYFPCVSQAVAASKTTRKYNFCLLVPPTLFPTRLRDHDYAAREVSIKIAGPVTGPQSLKLSHRHLHGTGYDPQY